MDERRTNPELLVVPGSCLQRFEIRRVLSRGGMGVVCVAWDRVCGRPVAIKFLRDELAYHAESNDRLVREASVLSRLRHPGVPSVHDMGVDPDGRAWYAMRLIEGSELRAEIEACHSKRASKPGRVPPVDLHWRELRILLNHLIAVAKTVHHSHKAGFLHRDLKPSNIFVSQHGESVLLDWGLAGRCQPSQDTIGQHASDASPTANTPKVDKTKTVVHDSLETATLNATANDDATDSILTNMLSQSPATGTDDIETIAQLLPHTEVTLDSKANSKASFTDSGASSRDQSDLCRRVLESDLTDHLVRLGTPAYMAPEMRLGNTESIGPRTDVFLLGATLFQVLTATPPFSRQEESEQALRARLSEKNVASDLVEICMMAMRANMEGRYESALAFANDLEHYLADEPIVACKETALRMAGRSIRRSWKMAAAASIMLIALTALIALAIVLNLRTKRFDLETRLLASEQREAELENDRQRRQVETARLFRDVNSLERVVREQAIGWSEQATQQLQNLDGRLGDDPQLLATVRGLRLRAALQFDLSDLSDERVGAKRLPNFAPGCFAMHPQNDLVAMGQVKAGMYVGLELCVGNWERSRWDSIASFSLTQGAINLFANQTPPGYRAVAFSPDGSKVFAGTRSGQLYCWTHNPSRTSDDWRETPAPKLLLETDGTINAIAISDDGLVLWLGTNKNWLQRLDLSHESTINFDPKNAVAPSGSSHVQHALLSRKLDSGPREIRLIDRGTLLVSPCQGPFLNPDTLQDLAGPSFYAKVASMHSDGNSLLLSGNDQELSIFDRQTGKSLRMLNSPRPISEGQNLHQSVSRDGAWLARAIQSSSNTRLELWDLMHGRLQAIVPLAEEREARVLVSGNSQQIWVGSNLPRLFRIEQGNAKIGSSLVSCRPIRNLMAANGVVIATDPQQSFALSTKTHRRKTLSTGPFTCAALFDPGPDYGLQIMALTTSGAENEVTLFEVAKEWELDSEPLRKLSTVQLENNIEAMEFAQDGTLWCAVAGTKYEMYTLQAVSSDGKIVNTIKPSRGIDLDSSFAVSALAIQGPFAIVGLRTGFLQVFDLNSDQQVAELTTGENARVLAIKMRPLVSTNNRNSIVAATNKKLAVCALRNGDLVTMTIDEAGKSEPLELRHLGAGNPSPVSAIAWLSDRYLACGRENGQFVIYEFVGDDSKAVLETRFDQGINFIQLCDQQVSLQFIGSGVIRFIPLQEIEAMFESR
jgi:serine/threonine protein kinase/WD40 repeat protein